MLRVRFRTLAEEIEDKLASMAAAPEPVARAFAARVDAELAPAEAARVREAHALLLDLTARSGTASARDHLPHTLRVASYVLAFQAPPDPETIRIALLHNVFEVFAADRQVLERAGLTARELDAIGRLTIDRARESDPEYLARFYGDIEAFGPDLALVRCVDKLDNLLGIKATDRGPVFESYVALARRFVLPIAQRLDATLAAFFDQTAAYLERRMGAS